MSAVSFAFSDDLYVPGIILCMSVALHGYIGSSEPRLIVPIPRRYSTTPVNCIVGSTQESCWHLFYLFLLELKILADQKQLCRCTYIAKLNLQTRSISTRYIQARHHHGLCLYGGAKAPTPLPPARFPAVHGISASHRQHE